MLRRIPGWFVACGSEERRREGLEAVGKMEQSRSEVGDRGRWY